ncbi:hypothetical protein DB41_FX00140 [Neochlamydia sp. TUME1]|uniref:hypothetical protein n=1 Tax=Neochlamydia sp. TUME1 TaxID=1478174 RepID=UPI000583B83F|nr:hypothetical protein [Neochlamydia sp. TUME1]KIC76505.1 hypothetical protein DB41_FX00140 [Neochlamydia sp. TUME1]
MMKHLLKFYHFLGSIQLAIMLMALAILVAAIGTILEAQSQSHLSSAYLTYHNPLFRSLAGGFFINIFVSALRRWPFRVRHIPFLITHCGLLMLLSGLIINNYYGIQGCMGLIEGGASDQIFLPHTYAIHLEKKGIENSYKNIQREYPLNQLMHQPVKFEDMEMRVIDYAPHSYERKETWVKGNQAIIAGIPPIPLIEFQDNKPLPPPFKAHFHHEKAQTWNLTALQTPFISETAKNFYLQNLIVKISETAGGKILVEEPLAKLLLAPLDIDTAQFSFALDWNDPTLNELTQPTLQVQINHEKMVIRLAGPDSLLNQNISSPHRGKLPFTLDLFKEPTCLIMQDEQEDNYLYFFNAHGEVYAQSFKKEKLTSITAYDEGFEGYKVQMPFPFEDFPCSRTDKEQAELLRIAIKLRQGLVQDSTLSPPLHLLKQAADASHQEFAEATVNFLQAWENSSSLLFTAPYSPLLERLFHKLNWNILPQQEQYACGWLCLFLDEIEKELEKEKNFSQILIKRKWPFALPFVSLDSNNIDHMITLFAQQLFAIASQLPPPPRMPVTFSAKALSAYLKVYNITLSNLREPMQSQPIIRSYHASRLYFDKVLKILSPLAPMRAPQLALLIHALPDNSYALEEIRKAYISYQIHNKEENLSYLPSKAELITHLLYHAPLETKTLSSEEISALSASLNADEVILKTPLTLKQTKDKSLPKWEHNLPLLTLELKEGTYKELITLTYDPYGKKLLWPVLKGKYLIRFQPLFRDIPYKIRLHDARQINYPGTSQPYSYESDIFIHDLKRNTRIEKTLSMNNIYQTAEGYRFYLANLSPPAEVAVQHAQILVNYDPAKYWLTYPGVLMISLGIGLLWWMQPYKKR